MIVKLKNPTRVYYCKEQKKSFAGKGEIPTKVTQHVRGLLNEGSLVEVLKSEITAEQKAQIVAEAKAEEAAKAEAARVAALSPEERKKELAEAKKAAEEAAKKSEQA